MELVEPLITQVIEVEFANANKLKDSLVMFLSQKEKDQPIGSVMVDERAIVIDVVLLVRAQSDRPDEVEAEHPHDRPGAQIAADPLRHELGHVSNEGEQEVRCSLYIAVDVRVRVDGASEV